MCILIVKPKGVLTPNEETLKTCFENNPDGAGFSYNKNGKVIIRKGFMTIEDFLKAVKKIPVDSTALIHCRIGTSGGKTQGLTHPYPLTNDYKSMLKTTHALEPVEWGKAYAVAHNGVFSGLGHHAVVNDTCEFIANFIKPLQDISQDILVDELDPVINRLVDTSRLAILDNYGNWKKYGNGWIEVDGIWYSNSTYKTYKYNYNTKWQDTYSWVDKNGKSCTYNKWYQGIVEDYGSYDNYLDTLELQRLEKLKKDYPADEEEIDAYFENGFSVWQIRHWLEEDYGVSK